MNPKEQLFEVVVKKNIENFPINVTSPNLGPVLEEKNDLLIEEHDNILSIPNCSYMVNKVLTSRKIIFPSNLSKEEQTPTRLSRLLEQAYGSDEEINQALRSYRHSKHHILLSSPPRAGQTIVLKIIDRILNIGETNLADEQTLAGRLQWFGMKNVQCSEKPQVFRTHFPIRCFVNSIPFFKDPKVVVILRDPIAIRYSWYKHLVNVFNYEHPTKEFPFTFEEFALNTGGPSTHMIDFSPLNDYESFIGTALQFVKNTKCYLLFYEEIKLNPQVTVEKLAKFLNVTMTSNDASNQLVQAIQEFTSNQVEHDDLMISDELKEHLENKWNLNVQQKAPYFFKSYSAMYQHFTNSTVD